MNANVFSNALGNVNEKYITEAMNYVPNKKKSWIKWGAMVACFALVVAIGIPVFNYLFSLQSGGPLPGDVHSDNPILPGDNPEASGDPVTPNTNEITYRSISADWPFYQNVQDLVDKSTLIVLGNVTSISFEVLDTRTARPATNETAEHNRSLYTLYEIDIIEQYKGNPVYTTQVRVLGGMKDIYLEEQAAVLGEDIKNGIPILENTPAINIGETYLFVLYQYEDTAPTLLNLEQSVFDLDSEENQSSLISAESIISHFN